MTKVFLLAVAASLDAGLVAAVVLLLGLPRGQSKLLAFWLGAIVLSSALGLLAVLVLSRPGLQVNQNGSASPEVEIVAGVAAGLAMIIKLDGGTTTNIFAVLGFNLVMFALLELPLVGFAVAPDRTRELVGRLHDWLDRQQRTIIVVASGAIGLYLLIAGLADLS